MGNTLKGIDAITDSVGNPLSLGAGFASQDWVEIDRVTVSAATTMDIEAFDPTLYEELEYTIIDLRLDSVDDYFALRFSDDDGVSYEATGYQWANLAQPSGTGSPSFQGHTSTEQTALQINLNGTDLSDGAGAATRNSFLRVNIIAHDSTTEDPQFLWHFNTPNSGDTGSWLSVGSGRMEDLASTLSGIRFLSNGGQDFSGTAVLRGRLKTGAAVTGFNPDWEVIDQQNIVASTTNIDLGVDLFDPTLYDEIEITISGLQLDTGGEFHMQVSDDNGATFEAGTGYEWCWVSTRADTGARQNSEAQDDADIELYSFIGTGATDNTFIKIQAGAIDNSLDKTFTWQVSRWITTLASYINGSGAFDGNTNNIDAFRFNSSADDITIGLFTLRGRRKNPQVGTPLTGVETLLSTQTITSGVATVDFSWVDDKYSSIRLEAEDVTAATDGADAWFRISEDNGSTYLSTSIYDWIRIFDASGTAGSNSRATVDAAFKTDTNGGNGTSEAMSFDITIRAPTSSNFKHLWGNLISFNDDASDSRFSKVAGSVRTTAQINGIQFLFDASGADNTNTGIFRLYGTLK